MAEVKAGNTTLPLTIDNGRARELETRYIELLEKRISVLERLLEEEKPASVVGLTNTTEENIQKALNGVITNIQQVDDFLSPSTSSPTSPTIPSACRILFQETRFDKEGVETTKDVSDKARTAPQQAPKENTSPDLVWRRVYDEKDKYDYSEVHINSIELHSLLHLELAHDPRFHAATQSMKDKLILTSPFECLIHSWARLEKLSQAESGSTVLKEFEKSLKDRISEVRPRTDIVTGYSDSSALVVLTKDDQRQKALVDLSALLSQIRETPELGQYFPTLEAQNQGNSVTFDYLWTIFPPGEVVYSEVFMRQPQVFIVKESEADFGQESDSGNSREVKKIWSVVCWSYDWDGKTFSRVPVTFKFEEYEGTRFINALHCHPLRYHETPDLGDQNTLKKDWVKRGKKFRELCTMKVGFQMFDYDGDAIVHGTGFHLLKSNQNEESESLFAMMFGRRSRRVALTDKQVKKQRIAGRVMVDFQSFLEQAPNIRRYGPMGDVVFSSEDDECRCASCATNQSLRNNQKIGFDGFTREEEFGDEDQYLLCPPRVLGYHLDSRTWVELDIHHIKEIVQVTSEEAFERLELVKAQKDLIRDLVKSHTSGTGKLPMMQDIMKDKGKGLVILLHGPPGVGKTLTAESVAELTGKPLFSVSPSDIGLNPAEVEHNLAALFELAARWRAVLLFDEADVFLESRSSHSSDLTRNALVSVLLRVLEYYSGILILTTNRIQQFDIAVQSRVNLGIRYKDLSKEQKAKIFTKFINQIKDENIESKDEVRNWFEEDTDASEWFENLNGRQVRNVLFSAASLAQSEGGVLKLRHIKKMGKATWQFQDSMKSIVEDARRKAEIGRG